MKTIVAIDGPAASGKSTTAKRVAERLGFVHLDTGAMYRAVTLVCLDRGIPPKESVELKRVLDSIDIHFGRDDDTGEQLTSVNGVEETVRIRLPEVNRRVSDYAALLVVREKLVILQRLIAQDDAVVCEGRDIGTRVFPDAEFKFFLNARLEVRARRRWAELRDGGHGANLENLMEELRRRDKIDATREHSPLKQADDAIVIDTSTLTINSQVELILQHIVDRGHGPVSSLAEGE